MSGLRLSIFKSLSEVPMWARFLRAARADFACDRAALVFTSGKAGHQEMLWFFDAPESGDSIKRAHSDGVFEGLAFERGVRRMYADAHGLLLALRNEAGEPFVLSLWRDAPFEENDEARIAALAPELLAGVAIFLRFAKLERSQSVSQTAIEAAGIGIFLADSDSNVLYSNALADSLAAKGEGLHVRSGRLTADNPTETRALADSIRDNAAKQSAQPDHGIYTPLALSRRDNPLPLTVIVRPGPGFHPVENPLRRTAMVIVRDPQRALFLPPAALERMFGLTPAEARLASALARGDSMEDAAQELGVTLNTARTQLRAVFGKTGVSRQGELVKLLLNSAGALFG